LARGRVVADGSTTEIKARVGGRTIRATLPGAEAEALDELADIAVVDRHGDTVTLTSGDSDRALRYLLERFPAAHDIEVYGAGIEEAFVVLTADTTTINDSMRQEV
jgi:ABC-2 type transport system ATP-binding protein